MKPKLFVGSSVEGLSIAYAVQQNLKYQAEVTVWDQGIFRLSDSALDSLIQLLDRVDFGVFVFTPDDIVNIRGEENRAVRDNVLFELGLFIGRFGKRRSFILMPDEVQDIRFPTDLLGMTPASYEISRADNNLQAATGPACHQIRQQIIGLGPINKSNELPSTPQYEKAISEGNPLESTNPLVGQQEAEAETGAEITETETAQTKEEKERNWWQLYHEDKYEEALSLLEKQLETTEDTEQRISTLHWIGRAKAHIDFEEGIKYLNNLLEEHPNNHSVYMSLAAAYWEAELPDEAIAILDKGIGLRVESYSWLKLMQANIKVSQVEEDDALRLLDELIEEDPNFYYSYARAAEILTKLGRKEEATKYYELGLKALPNNKSILFEYGKHLIDVKNNSGATAIFRKLINLDSKNSAYFGYLGNAYLQLDYYGLALEAYEKANTLAEEKESWIIANIGNIYNYRGFYPQAINYLEKGIELDSQSAYAHERLAYAIKADEEERKKATETVRQYLLSQKKQEQHQDEQKLEDEAAVNAELPLNEEGK